MTVLYASVTFKRCTYRNSSVGKNLLEQLNQKGENKNGCETMTWSNPFIFQMKNSKPSENLPFSSTKVNSKLRRCAVEEESPFEK